MDSMIITIPTTTTTTTTFTKQMYTAPPHIELIINEFQKWLQTDKVITYFKTKYNANKLLPQLHEKIGQFHEKRRTLARTARIKNELDDIGYVPDDRQNSIKGTIYRRKKNSFDKNKTITKRESNGGKKKKKTNKNMRFK